MRRLLVAALTLAAAAAMGPMPAAAGPAIPVQGCGLLVFNCPTPPPPPITATPPPQPFSLPPVAAPTLPPVATQPPAPPTAAAGTPSPSASAAAIPRITPSPAPSATPITIGSDRNVAIPTIQPSSTGSSLDGGGLLIRLFVVLALLAGGSVASMFALR